MTKIPSTITTPSQMGVPKIESFVNKHLECTDTLPGYSCNWNVPVKSGVLQACTCKDSTGLSPALMVTSSK